MLHFGVEHLHAARPHRMGFWEVVRYLPQYIKLLILLNKCKSTKFGVNNICLHCLWIILLDYFNTSGFIEVNHVHCCSLYFLGYLYTRCKGGQLTHHMH